jgi:hypothetical protein
VAATRPALKPLLVTRLIAPPPVIIVIVVAPATPHPLLNVRWKSAPPSPISAPGVRPDAEPLFYVRG